MNNKFTSSSSSSVSSLNSSGRHWSWKKNTNPLPVVPAAAAKAVVIKGEIISSRFADVETFVPSYMKTERRPDMSSLISMEYFRIWQREHETYEKNVIEKKLTKPKKRKPLKRPTTISSSSSISNTFQSNNNNCCSDRAAGGAGDAALSGRKKNEICKRVPQVLVSNKPNPSKPLKSVWK